MGERILFGFFSETACAERGSVYYSTLDGGGEVEVTCVSEDPEGKAYLWPDKTNRGRVGRYLASRQTRFAIELPLGGDMSEELVVRQPDAIQHGASLYMPAMSVEVAVERYKAVDQFIRQIMEEGKDYGTIPGTDKPTLYQDGAQKLCNFFGLSNRISITEKVLDWTGADHGGEPFFYFEVKCQLERNGLVVGEGIGSANSWESKYRYRWVRADQLPPGADIAQFAKKEGRISEPAFAIDKAKTSGQYGKPAAYWDRWKKAIAEGRATQVKIPKKAGGAMDGWEIETVLYRIPNPEFPDVVNTCKKIAAKRAYVAAVKNTTAAGRFTQDLEDQGPAPEGPPEYEPEPEPPSKPIFKPRGTTDTPPSTVMGGGEAATSRGEEQTAGVHPAGTSVKSPSALPGRSEPGLDAAIVAVWTRAGNKMSTILPEFQALKKDVVEMTGSEVPYYEVLREYDWQHASKETVKEAGTQKVHAVLAALVRKIWAIRASLAEPEPPGYAATDDDVPEEIRG